MNHAFPSKSPIANSRAPPLWELISLPRNHCADKRQKTGAIMPDYGELEYINRLRWPRIWWVGIPAPFWIDNQKEVAEFIKKNDLAPMVQKEMSALLFSAFPHWEPLQKEKPEPLKPEIIPGGIRIPHLHHAGEIYPLTHKQWRKFSGKALAKLKARLDEAQTISHRHLMELDEAVDKIVP